MALRKKDVTLTLVLMNAVAVRTEVTLTLVLMNEWL